MCKKTSPERRMAFFVLLSFLSLTHAAAGLQSSGNYGKIQNALLLICCIYISGCDLLTLKHLTLFLKIFRSCKRFVFSLKLNAYSKINN